MSKNPMNLNKKCLQIQGTKYLENMTSYILNNIRVHISYIRRNMILNYVHSIE